ncbi:hypothetical protein JCM1840_004934 [Sporobolomyces johnsonii]
MLRVRPRLAVRSPRLRLLFQALHSSSRIDGTLGLRAEDPARIWERRAPLTPKACAQLVREQHTVLVEKSPKRVFSDGEYEQAGAQLLDTLDARRCDVVVGVKEPVLSTLVAVAAPSTTHVAFFHCHKGQAYNLPLLRRLLASRSRVVDYELLTDGEGGRRTTGFGTLAGFSGMADGLSALGTKLVAARRVATPFLKLARPLQAGTVARMEEGLREVGREIEDEGIAREAGPIVITISGRGKVGEGARQALNQLPVKWIKAHELERTVRDPATDLRRIYACHLELGDYLVSREGQPFDREQYRKHPEDFTSVFHEKIAPFTTLFLNGGFFAPGCPRLLSTKQLAQLQRNPETRLLSIVDVSCDFGGGLEFVTHPTTLDDPIVQFDAVTRCLHRDPSHPTSTQLSSVEILPSALPLDATEQFSTSVLPYIRALLEGTSSTASSASVLAALERATVARGGKLEKKHEWLHGLLGGGVAEPQRKKAVLLGAGLVAGPAVRTLASKENLDVVLASNDLAAAQKLASQYSNVAAVHLDASDKVALRKLIAGSDVVLSLLPAPLHVDVAKLCIECKVSLVTASYTSPEMAQLHEQAQRAGIVLLNELGLDPGIDHCSAAALIEEARATGNELVSFVSFCGGLPSPESSGGPLGYKFSWSPRGVLTAALNSASYRINSRDVDIDGTDLLRQGFKSVPILRGFDLEGIANRNSLAYLAQYGLPDDLPTILRGTLRYPGFSRIVDAFKKIGLLQSEKLHHRVSSWKDLVDSCLRSKGFEVRDDKSRRTALCATLGDVDPALVDDVLSTLSELALLPNADSATPPPPLSSSHTAPIDLFSTILAHQLKYNPGERDMVILHHELTTRSTTSGESELFTSTLVQYGTATDSAMATTVGIPIALGALLVLEGEIRARGLVSPTSPEVWRPLLGQLEKSGIRSVERRKKGTRGILDVLEKQVQAGVAA